MSNCPAVTGNYPDVIGTDKHVHMRYEAIFAFVLTYVSHIKFSAISSLWSVPLVQNATENSSLISDETIAIDIVLAIITGKETTLLHSFFTFANSI